MTYIERALYDFVKTILTRGIRTLTDSKYLPYTIFLLLIVITSTVSVFLDDLTGLVISDDQRDILLFVELSAALGFVIIGLLLGKLRTLIQVSTLVGLTIFFSALLFFGVVPTADKFAMFLAALFYISWIVVASFSTFSLFRDLFESDVFGMILFLGKPEDDGKPMFSLIALILIVLNTFLGYFIYNQSFTLDSTALRYSGIIVIFFSIIALFPLINPHGKYDVFYTIITTFYMFTTIRIVVLAFKSLSNTPGDTSLWDTIFSLFIALYAIQNAAVKGIKIGEIDDDIELSVEEKLMAKEKRSLGFSKKITSLVGDRGIVLIILGLVIGFHALQVQSFLGRQNLFNQFEYTADADIILLGYEANLAISFLIYMFSLLAFLFIPSFRRYANPDVKRVVWAPDYEDLKLLAIAVKAGDLNWKSEALKIGKDLSTAKLKGFVSSSTSMEDTIKNSITGMIDKVKDGKKDDN